MSRSPRIISKTGYYHVMSRGINKQDIFLDAYDKKKYLNCIVDAISKYDIQLVAYCLMSNHNHLLLYDINQDLSHFMHYVNSVYANYFNNKHNRLGPLFHDRFKSEAIKDERQLLATFRYIINNPLKAKICKPEEYKWCSYWEYNKNNSILNLSVIKNLIVNDNDYKEFINSYSTENFLDNEISNKNSNYANKTIKQKYYDINVSNMKYQVKKIRNDCILLLKTNGFSCQEIHDMTNISKNIIYKI